MQLGYIHFVHEEERGTSKGELTPVDDDASKPSLPTCSNHRIHRIVLTFVNHTIGLWTKSVLQIAHDKFRSRRNQHVNLDGHLEYLAETIETETGIGRWWTLFRSIESVIARPLLLQIPKSTNGFSSSLSIIALVCCPSSDVGASRTHQTRRCYLWLQWLEEQFVIVKRPVSVPFSLWSDNPGDQ